MTSPIPPATDFATSRQLSAKIVAMFRTPHSRALTALLALLIFVAVAPSAHAQISFGAAIDLALRNSPRVKMAELDVSKARAVLEETHDVYIPALSVGSGLGYTYGFPLGAPTLYNVTIQSLAYDQSQQSYIRAARAGLEAANSSLKDVRQQVAEDAATTYIALDADLERLKAARDEATFGTDLTKIIQQRLEAGQDTQVELTRSRLTTATLFLRQIQLEDDTSFQRSHLARLTGLASNTLTTEHESIPSVPPLDRSSAGDGALPASVQAAYSTAQSKLQTAVGDSRKLYRPQVGLAANYSRFASFNNYAQYYNSFQANNFSIGIQFNLPVFDFTKRAKARESMAEAHHSLLEADQARDQFFEGRRKIGNAVRELQARADVASLQRELAQNELDVVQIQLKDGNPNGQPVTPKEEKNARIQERARYLDYLDADLQLRQTQINLLRSNGQLEDWLKSTSTTLSAPVPSKP